MHKANPMFFPSQAGGDRGEPEEPARREQVNDRKEKGPERAKLEKGATDATQGSGQPPAPPVDSSTEEKKFPPGRVYGVGVVILPHRVVL